MPIVEPLREGDPAAMGPYRLVGRLGAGGHGVAYLGQARDGTPVAVKVLREGPVAAERLARDIAAAREVEPFCVARVLDASTGGRPYIVSEYVDGPSLQQAGPREGAELQRLAVATATALDAIHQAGVVHGDFTPSNVLLGADGARVVDFGIAAALGSGVKATSAIVGTPAYMAPEQLAGEAVGAAADVFSWASVLVYAAKGVPPFGDDSLPAVIHRILREEPRLGDLPGPLREIVPVCLAKDPAARPAMRDVLLRLAAPFRRPTPHPAPTPLPARHQAPGPTSAGHRTAERASAWFQHADETPVRVQRPEHVPRPAMAPGSPARPSLAPPEDPTAYEGPGQATEPLQALLDLSSPVEPPHDRLTRTPVQKPDDRLVYAPAHEPDDRLAGVPGSGSVFDVSGAEPPGDGTAGAESGSGGGREPARRPRGRRIKTVIIAVFSGVTVCALAGAIVWLTPTTPTPKATSVSVATGVPTMEPAATPSRTTRRTRQPGDDAGRLTVAYVRAGGTRNGDCWAGGEATLRALVRRTGGPLTFTYTWLIDGTATGRATAVIPENGRRYVTSPRTLQATGGTHSVTLRITSPVTAERTISVAMCDETTF